MINIAPNIALELSLDELGLHVLKDIIANNVDSEYNYLLKYVEDGQFGYQNNPEAYNAISESIGWLRSQNMIANKPGDIRASSIMVTRWGYKSIDIGTRGVMAMTRLQDNLHPDIAVKARRQFLLGEYENAIFVAMKAVEVRVRKLADYGNDVTGVDLMTKAFKKGGPLADVHAPSGEVQGTMMLFTGAYAVLRNPSGHREVEFDDMTEASEAVMTASMLLRILDKVAKR